ncbi:MAG: PIN domain-containing protein [Acidimicrobiia bacterium]|nr:PIN domain-containing protein [Acidimicrobiia bacterium]
MIFADTSGFYALADMNDHNHASAGSVMAALTDDEIVTHSYVLSESVSLLHARFGRDAVKGFRENVLPRVDRVVWIGASIHDVALDALVGSTSKRGPSFVDLVSFEVMRREGIRRAFAFDRDFVRAGFELVR